MDDIISRQAAIDVLKKAYWDKDIQSARNDPCIVDAMTDWAIRQVKVLPSAKIESSTDIIRNAVRKYWTEESQHPESVVVYFYQKYDFDSDDKWVLHAEYVMPHSSDDFSTVIFEHDFCKGQSDVKDINIVSAEKVFDFYYYAMFHWKGL